MANKYPFFKQERQWALLKYSLLELFFLGVVQPIGNYLFYESMTLTDLFSIRISLVLLAIFAIFVIRKLWEWYKEDYEKWEKDEDLVRKDLVKTLEKLHEKQTFLILNSENADKSEVKETKESIRDLMKDLSHHRSNDVVAKIKAKKELDNEPY